MRCCGSAGADLCSDCGLRSGLFLMLKRAVVLGSTGSIGRNALAVIDALRDEWMVAGLAAGADGRHLAEQANRFRPAAVALADERRAGELRSALVYEPRIRLGADAQVRLLEEVACDGVVSAVVGAGGLAGTLKAVEQGRRVALANKEAMVMAGALLVPLAKRTGATIIPVDSEHSAIFQALQGGRREDVERVYLTASGGPFRTWSLEAMEHVTVEEALRHPTWNMGPKITIDSATMMNKALEIVEARWLFDLPADKIEVVIHPESIIHALVEYRDGALLAQMSAPDMRMPIQYALTYPSRRACPAPRLDLGTVRQLTLQPPDVDRFPALRLGRVVAERGGTCGAVLNAGNEAAVELFREGLIPFTEIARGTERALEGHEFKAAATLEDLLAADRWARQEVTRCLSC
ncbi:MAG TPA: 1-deoxy-D-xylulose-5-phosphate reductoisomerase [Phycisphaerae bacterium]|nr:1-deoxy-D-xylulose-5-phosphate reductoisomerase [Phycisphaerae bacterium]HNU47052.1 1-deoxy-D-xylulose-5-phosphate reductoisomerase [Phycisphaerae bacterium]